MRRSLIFVIVTALLMSYSCGNGEPKMAPYDIDSINLEYSDLKSIPIDSVVTNVRFVRLETNENCLIESYDEIQVVDEMIFIRSSGGGQQALFVFDLEGNHLFSIVTQGRGPGEYLAMSGFYVNSEEKEIGILDLGKVLIFDYNGKYLRSHSFERLGLVPCDISPSLISFNGHFYVIVNTFETMGIEPVKGWGAELMKDDMFNLVAVYNSEWKLVKRAYPIPRERSGIQYRYQLQEGGQKKAFSTDGEKLWFHSIFSDYIYEVVDNEFIPRFMLDYGRHKISEKQYNEAIKASEYQTMDYYFTFFNGNYGFPGSQYTMNGSLILMKPMIGRASPLILYDKSTKKSLVLAMTKNDKIGNSANLYPSRGVGTYDGGFFGHIPADQIFLARKRGRAYSKVSPLSPLNFPEYDQILNDDNAVIVFFDIKGDK